MVAGFCGVIHYICIYNILSVLSDPRGLEYGWLKSVFIPIILLNLSIVGLVPCCCCCQKKKEAGNDEDYDSIKFYRKDIEVSRIVFTVKDENSLNEFERKREVPKESEKK